MLKTLRDLDYIEMNYEKTTDNSKLESCPAYMGHKIRIEGINWIRFLQDNDCEVLSSFIGGCEACYEGQGVCNKEHIINFIKLFFNITEGVLVQ